MLHCWVQRPVSPLSLWYWGKKQKRLKIDSLASRALPFFKYAINTGRISEWGYVIPPESEGTPAACSLFGKKKKKREVYSDAIYAIIHCHTCNFVQCRGPSFVLDGMFIPFFADANAQWNSPSLLFGCKFCLLYLHA